MDNISKDKKLFSYSIDEYTQSWLRMTYFFGGEMTRTSLLTISGLRELF